MPNPPFPVPIHCRITANSAGQSAESLAWGRPAPELSVGSAAGLHDLSEAQRAVGQGGVRAELIGPLIATARAMHHDVFQLNQTHEIPPQRPILPT